MLKVNVNTIWTQMTLKSKWVYWKKNWTKYLYILAYLNSYLKTYWVMSITVLKFQRPKNFAFFV